MKTLFSWPEKLLESQTKDLGLGGCGARFGVLAWEGQWDLGCWSGTPISEKGARELVSLSSQGKVPAGRLDPLCPRYSATTGRAEIRGGSKFHPGDGPWSVGIPCLGPHRVKTHYVLSSGQAASS